MTLINKTTFFFLSAIFLCSPVFAQPAPQEELGYLQIQCERSGVEIFVDGKTVGKTPLPTLALTAGKHTITALNPDRFLWGQFDWREDISISPADTLLVRPKFAEVIVLRSEPDGARVYLNNQLIGETPLYFIQKIEAGAKFTIRKKYFIPETVVFKGKYPAFYNIRLSRDEIKYRQHLSAVHFKELKQARFRKATYGLWAASLASGLSAIYFKQEANKNYRNYLNSASLTKMNRYFDNSLRYDNYSNITLGAFQGCFWLSLYTLYRAYR